GQLRPAPECPREVQGPAVLPAQPDRDADAHHPRRERPAGQGDRPQGQRGPRAHRRLRPPPRGVRAGPRGPALLVARGPRRPVGPTPAVAEPARRAGRAGPAPQRPALRPGDGGPAPGHAAPPGTELIIDLYFLYFLGALLAFQVHGHRRAVGGPVRAGVLVRLL